MRARTLVLLGTVSLATVRADAARVEIILDVSGSMRARMGSETRMEAARKAIRATLAGVQPESVVGLRLYGHRVSPDDKAESCRDSELAVPFKKLDKAEFLKVVDAAQPRGQTPLTFSLEEAARDFGPASDEERVIILVSDGAESCGGDPAAATRNLLAEGFKLKVHTIGFDVDAAARAQLEAISTVTGGEYHDAKNAVALAESLTELAQKSLLIDKREDALGQPVRGGDGHDGAVEIQPGRVYRLDHHQRPGEYDYFYVPLTGKKRITVSLEMPQVGVEIGGKSFRTTSRPSGGLVLQDGERRKLGEIQILFERGAKETLEGSVTEEAGGRLYVLVGSADHAQHKDSRFSVTFAAPRGDAGTAVDAGDSAAEALEIKPGAHKGHLEPGDISDFFKIAVNPTATYHVRVTPMNLQAWLELSVEAAIGEPSKSNVAPQGDTARVGELKFPKGGTAYIRVAYYRHWQDRQATAYSLDVIEEGASAPPPDAAAAPPPPPPPPDALPKAAPRPDAAATPPPPPITPPTAQAQPERPAAGGPEPPLLERFVSFLLRSVVPAVVALLVGGIYGYVKGRRHGRSKPPKR